MNSPEQWAQAAVKHLGAVDAARLAYLYCREFLGVDSSSLNPHRAFYLQAFNFIRKHHTSELEAA
jgi:hypothetical protein